MLLQSGLKFRNFAQQSAFSFDLDLSLSSSSGYSTFGISGSGGACDLFKFKNGMVYDPLGRFVYSYSPSESLNISGNFYSGALGYYINSNPIALNVNAYNSTGLFDTIYFSTSNSDMNFEVDVYGYKLPTYNFIFNDSSFLTGSNIIGNILNTSADNRSSFRVFSGSASFGYTGYKFQSVLSNSIISPSKSGTFSFNYSGDGSDYSISSSTGVEPLSYNINLYTDFGLINKTGVIDLGYSPLYFTDFYLENSGYVNNEYFKNYYLEGKVCDNSPFVFKLEKISGFDYVNNATGSLNFTGFATGIVSGYIYGTGFLNGQVKGQDFISTQMDYYNNPVILSGFTGVHSGDLSYGTGFIDAGGYSVVDSISGSVFGSGFLNEITNNIYESVTRDAVSKNFIYSSGDSIGGVEYIITGAKASGEVYKHFIPGTFYITNPNPAITPVGGVFTGQNISNLTYTGSVVGSGIVYSPSNYSLIFSGAFNGVDPTGGLIVQNLTSGVNYVNSTLSDGASVSGVSRSINYSQFIFSGNQSGFYLDSGSNVISGKYILRGLTGNFNITPNTNSGTYFVNSLLTGSSLMVDTGNFYAYYAAFGDYPQSFNNTWASGYSIGSDLDYLGFTPFKYGMGDPLNWEHRDFSWQGMSYFYSNSSLDQSYITLTFNSDVVAPGFVCDSYCMAPHPEYPSPSSWSISGSNDGSNWVLLDSRSGQNLEKQYLKVFDFTNSTFYKYLHFKINSTDNPALHIPRISDDDILYDSYGRGFSKFVFLKKIKINKFLSLIDKPIPQLASNTNLSGSSASFSPNEWYKAFDATSNNSFAIIYNGNLNTNNSSNRGVIIGKNLQNTGVTSLDDLSSATSVNNIAFNDLYNFYGGGFTSFKGSGRNNFAVTNKNNTLSASGVYSTTNPVVMISTGSGNNLVFSSSGETRFLSGLGLSTLNSNLYPSSVFTSAERTDKYWKLGGSFGNTFTADRTTFFSPTLQNSNGADYVLNNGLIYTNMSGVYITGFPLVRNTGATGPANWESGVDSDGFSQLRYNLFNEQNSSLKNINVSGVISHDLYIPQINKTKRVTYLYGDFVGSKFFKGRGSEGNGTNTLSNSQGRYLYAQKMSTGRDCLLNYEFINSGFYGGNCIQSMVVDTTGQNLMCFGDFSVFPPGVANRGHLAFFSLPTSNDQTPYAQDLRNAYNGIYDPLSSGLTTGGFIMKNLPIFNCDNNIVCSTLSGVSGLFLGGNFSNARINSTFTSSFQRAILLNTSGNLGTGIIVTGYGINAGTVNAIDYDNYGRVHLGGDFTTTLTSARNRYACYGAYNATLQSLDLNFNNVVYGINCDRSNNSMFVVGDFTTVSGSIARNRAVKINLTNNTIDGWNNGAGFNARVRGVVTGLNGDLIFYGGFSQFSGINCRNIARFNSAGIFVTGGAIHYQNDTDAMIGFTNADAASCVVDPVDKSIYLLFKGANTNYGADITYGNTFNYNYRRMIRYDYSTLKPSGVAPSFAFGNGNDIKYWNNRIIVGGGNFGRGVSQFTNGIAAFTDEPTGTLLTFFNPNLNGVVNSACKVSDGLILAGDFRSCDGYAASGLVKIDFYGNRMTGFTPNCQNPNIVKIKNTASGVFAFSTKPWNSSTSGNFYKIDPANGSLLTNYSFNLNSSSYSPGDFFIDTGVNSIGHVVMGNITQYNPTCFIEYTFPSAINAIQGYNINFTGTPPSILNVMISGQSDTQYRTIDTKNTQSNGYFYSNYNIDYPLSGIKKIKFDFLITGVTGSVGVSNITVYEKKSGYLSGLSLSLSDVRGSGAVSYTGVPYAFYTGYDYLYPYADPTHLGVNAVYEYTGYFPASGFSGINVLSSTFSGITDNGKYKTSKSFQSFAITPSSGSSIINNIKINEITGVRRSSISVKLKPGFDACLTENSDMISFNTGSFNLSSQDVFTFKYKKNLYNPSSNSEFSGISDLVYKVNTFHSNWISGSYNNSTRVLEFYSPTGIGYSGNYMYMQPVIKSGINNFFDSSFNFSSSGFYFTGGDTYFLNMNTGVSGFHSGIFATGTGSATGEVYFHKTEYQNVYKKQVPYLVEKYASNFFTGYTSTSYSGYNNYSSLSYASGNMTYNYSVYLTGFASGYDSSTSSSGIVTGVINKTGQLTTQAVSGVGIWSNIALTGSGSAGQVYVIPRGGSQYTEVSNYWYGDFVGLFNFNITNSGYYSVSTGVSTSVTADSKWIDYDARFDYNFNIKTGAFSNDGIYMYSGVSVPYNSGNNMYSGSGILNSTSCLPFSSPPSRYVKFEIKHYNPYNSGNNIMKYTISGITGSYLFTGLIEE